MTVAVATRVEGFTTLPQLVSPIAFHAVFSIVGLELLRAAARLADVAKPAGGPEEALPATRGSV